MASTVQAQQDEDAFLPPASWRRTVLPRRDGYLGPPEVVPDPDAAANVAATLARYRTGIDGLLASERSDPVLVAAVRTVIGGGEPTPLGCAGLAIGVSICAGWNELDFEPWVDHWATQYGLRFMAEAVVESLAVSGFARGLLLRSSELGSWWWSGRRLKLVERARTLITTGSDEDVAATRVGLERFRTDPEQGMVAAVSLPHERNWVAAEVDACERGGSLLACSLLVETVAEPALLARLWGVARRAMRVDFGASMIRSSATAATIADGVGPAAAAVLGAVLDAPVPQKARKQPVANVLATFPTDEAFLILEARSEQPTARIALAAASLRFPKRALRLLGPAAAAGRNVEQFRAHVANHRDLAQDRLASLEPGVAQLVRDELEGRAAPSQDSVLPAILSEPPWLRARPKPAVVSGLEPPRDVRCVWAPGERERWTLELGVLTAEEIQRHLDERDEKWLVYGVYWALAYSDRDVALPIGSTAALAALKELSEKVKTRRVREGARGKIVEVADGLGLTADQLADRLVPDLGLDADGTCVLDYGLRQFVVGSTSCSGRW